jgi:photosystem II stability/assembly factor-like uncharacterized protein
MREWNVRKPIAHLIAAPAVLFLSFLGACGTGPHLEVPTPGEENYTALRPAAINAVSAAEVFVVGEMVRTDGTPEGLILLTETGGQTWRRLAVEIHDLRRTSFQAVYFIDRLRGWVAGIRVDSVGRTRPIIFYTDDGGNHFREAYLPQDPSLIATEAHNLLFTSDRDGAVGVSFTDPKTGKSGETYFVTQDAGRSWIVSAYRQDPKQPFYDQTQTFIDAKRGFRLVKTTYPGVTMVETTGSGGEDWMPICELSLGALSTYY